MRDSSGNPVVQHYEKTLAHLTLLLKRSPRKTSVFHAALNGCKLVRLLTLFRYKRNLPKSTIVKKKVQPIYEIIFLFSFAVFLLMLSPHKERQLLFP